MPQALSGTSQARRRGEKTAGAREGPGDARWTCRSRRSLPLSLTFCFEAMEIQSVTAEVDWNEEGQRIAVAAALLYNLQGHRVKQMQRSVSVQGSGRMCRREI